LGKGLRLYQTDETVDAIDILLLKRLLRIDSNAKEVLEGKAAWREFIDNYCGTKELVTLLEKVANSSKNEDVIKEISAT
jgi:hypothetical protein